MTVLPFLALSFGFGTLSLLTRRLSGVSFLLGVVGLVAAAAAALWIVPGDRLAIGDGLILGSAYQRLFLALGCGTYGVLCLMGLTGGWQPNLPGAALAGFGA